MNHTDKKAVNPRLHKGSKGTYEIRWSEDGRSKRVSTGTQDLAEANLRLASFIHERADTRRASENPSVRDILNNYTREHVEPNLRSAPSYERQRDCVTNLDRGLGDVLVSELGAGHARTYAVQRASGMHGRRKAGDSTVRRELGTLVAALNHARRNRVIADVPHIPLPKEAPPKDLWLTESELSVLLEHAVHVGGRGRMFIEIAAATASRKDAIMRLQWKHVDLKDGIINFQDIDLPMTRKRRVPVPMSKRLRSYLEGVRDRRGYPGGDEFLMGNSSSVRRDFERICSQAAKATGNAKFLSVTPHVLRHTWATLAAKNRVPVFEIAGVLGDNVQTVTRVYAKHHPDHLRAAVGFMDSLAR